MEKIFEVTGYTIKEEQVGFLRHNIMPNTFVVNVNHPFPGYHGMPMIENSKPRSILLVTKKKYSWEKILRASDKINKFTDYNLIGSSATIWIGNNQFDAIRLKGLPSYSEVPVIQHAYAEEGFEFMKKRSMKDDLTVTIKVSKFYDIQQMEENIYKDVKIDHMYYIVIPHNLNWELFRKITMRIKNNISNRNFDVVLGVFFKSYTVKDMIRVFKPGISEELLKEIKDLYYKEIDRYF